MTGSSSTSALASVCSTLRSGRLHARLIRRDLLLRVSVAAEGGESNPPRPKAPDPKSGGPPLHHSRVRRLDGAGRPVSPGWVAGDGRKGWTAAGVWQAVARASRPSRDPAGDRRRPRVAGRDLDHLALPHQSRSASPPRASRPPLRLAAVAGGHRRGRRHRPADHRGRRPQGPAPQGLPLRDAAAAGARVHPRRDPVGPGQESVWDYPRPPSARGHAASGRRRARRPGHRRDRPGGPRLRDQPPAGSTTSPATDIVDGVLQRAAGGSWCEWKGRATYWDAVVDGRRLAGGRLVLRAAARPATPHLRGAVAFYPAALDRARSRARPCGRSPGLLRRLASPTRSSDRSRASQARSAGERAPGQAGASPGSAAGRRSRGPRRCRPASTGSPVSSQRCTSGALVASAMSGRTGRGRPRRAPGPVIHIWSKAAPPHRRAVHCGTPRPAPARAASPTAASSVAAPDGPFDVPQQRLEHRAQVALEATRCRAASPGAVELGDGVDDEILLRAPAAVDRRLADTRLGGDGIHRQRAIAHVGEQREDGRPDDAVAAGVARSPASTGAGGVRDRSGHAQTLNT